MNRTEEVKRYLEIAEDPPSIRGGHPKQYEMMPRMVDENGLEVARR